MQQLPDLTAARDVVLDLLVAEWTLRRQAGETIALAEYLQRFPAWAEDPIGVASVHDLSGGLDIYGKPMVDALTLAVEEANAAGGLQGGGIAIQRG